ncbi:MAG TPA: hypothetical protein PLB52_03750 [Candidatus Moranbacteria bacterium]|nr:hypothetical protein [Candidatus Moranbacteria bacterium]
MKIIEANSFYKKRGLCYAIELEPEDIEKLKEYIKRDETKEKDAKKEILSLIIFAESNGLIGRNRKFEAIVFQASDGIQWDAPPEVSEIEELLPCVV